MKNTFTPLTQIISILCLLFVCNFKLSAQTFPTPTGLTLPNGKTIVITYDVDVNANACPDGTIPAANISNQSNVSGSNFATVQTDEPSNPAANPSPTITPFGALTIGNLVYKDNNKNGIFDGGDVGINGVLLRLYLDNGDGVLTVADGAAVLTTTTAGGGLYTFNPVCPGNYIVEAAASNFNSGGPLYDSGLSSPFVSSPVGAAPDPDNDVNNDDNGDPVSGFGVASAAITLAYNTEPISDGDALANTNLSLDMGFKAPTTITITDVSISEGNGGGTTAYNFIVTRSDAIEAFSLTVNTADGTAVSPADFASITGGTVTFTAGGSLTATVTVNVVADNIVEPNETFTVVLSGPPAGVVLSDASGLGTIGNDDAAVVTLTGTASQNEGTPIVFTATLNNAVQGGFSVAYTTNDGTALLSDADYTDNDGPALVFAGTAGESHTITVNTTSDNKVELNETFTVGLGAVTGSPGGVTTTGSPQTGTILNDDQSIVSIVPVSMNEGNAGPTVFTFTATLSNAVDVGVGVPFSTSDGTAIDVFSGVGTDDYNSNSGTLNFTGTAGETKTFNVQVNGDLVVEPNETFNAMLNSIITSGRNVIFTGGAASLSVTGTIVNDDNAVVTLSGGTNVNEGNTGTTPMVFTMTLNNPVESSFVVNYKTFDGTATTGDNDYIGVDASAVFMGNAGETKMFTVNIKGDLNIENTEMFTAAITDITGTPIMGSVTAAGSPQTGTITNDELDWGDAPTAAQSGFAGTYPTLSANNGARHSELPGGLHLGATVDADLDGQPNTTATGDGADEDGVTLPAALITSTTANITVNASAAGKLDGWVDFNRDGDWADAGEQIYTSTNVVAGPNTLTFAVPAGASVGTSFARFRVSTSGALAVTGLAADGEVEDYQVSIIANQFSINSPSVAEGNAGTTNLTFTVTRTTNSTADAVDYAITGGTATSGTDYAPLAAGTLMFPSGGALSQTITVTVNGDLVIEADETVIITLSNPVNGGLGTNPGTGTITNDDSGTLVLTGGIAQNEGNAGTTSYIFTATLTGDVQGGFQVPYTTNNGTATTADADYIDNDGTLTFAGTTGETKTFTVLVNGDTKVELDETFTTALGAITGSPAAASITVSGSPQTGTITNDDAAVVSIAADVSQNEIVTPQVFNVTLSNPVDVPVTVLFNTSNGTATTADPDYTGVVNQTVTFAAGTTTTQVVNVTIINDTKVEDNEVFNVAIGTLNASGRNVTLGTTTRTGTILNDDTVTLTLSGGGSANEGNSGTNARVFNVTLGTGIQSGLVDPNGHPRGTVQSVQGGFTVAYFTNDGTATTANNDYVDNDGTLTFAGNSGEVKQITVLVNGDLNIENDETFTVTIGAITNTSPVQIAAITEVGSPQTGTIVNDELDWGDAPTAAQSGFPGTYPTLLSDSGPRHMELPGGLHLGATVDADLNGQPNATATGDGADEDGVTLPAAFIINTSTNITVNASGTGNLNAWMDFNRDGDFVDAGEQIFTNTVVNAGNNVLSVATPAGASLGTSFARFRLSTQVNSGIGGLATDGEVEDYQISINNNTIAIDNPSVVEGNAGTVNLVYTVSRTTNATASSVDYAITGGTATSGTDYAPLAAGTINFTAGGALTQTITVVVNGDIVVEADETVIMTLSNPVNGAIGANPGTGTIINDDAASLVLTGGIAQNESNAGTVAYVFTATLNPTVQGGFMVAYTTNDGTATTADNDYQDNDGTLTFAGTPGETKTFTVLVNGDTKVELNETFTAALGAITNTTAPAGSITISGSPQTGTITNDDAAVVNLANDVSQLETLTPQVFTVTLSNPVDVPVTVLFNTSDGTAMTSDNDYTGITNQTVTFPAGTTTTQVVNVTIIDDNKVENNEVFNTAIGTLNASGRNVTMGTTARTGTILNNDHAAVTLSGGISHPEGNTGTTPFVFTVQVNRPVQGGFTANFTTNDGTATIANNDYMDNDGSLVFAGTAGESHTITVLANGDLNIEPNETFTVSLNGLVTMVTPTDVTISGSPQTGTIQNDELDWGDAPTAAQSGFAGTYPTSLADNGARHGEAPAGLHLGATVDADLDGQPNNTATGDGADEDGVTLPGALVINTTANITVNSSGSGLLDAWVDYNRDGDWVDAGEKIFTNQAVVAGNNNLSFFVPASATLGNSFARFRLSTAGGTLASGLAPDGEVEDYAINIVNTQFSINDPVVTEGNAGTTNLVFTITRTNNSNNCSIDYAITGGTATTADLDYQSLAAGTLSFTSGGALTQTVTVVVNGDIKVELDETVIMTLSNPVNSSILDGTGVGTITNDDSGVITITSPSIVEGDAGTQNLVFNINMTAISDANVSFNWATANGTATSGSDYVANSGTITLTPGQTTATITIVINGDCTIEPNEIFSVILSSLNANGRNITFSPSGSTLTGTGTIINEDFLPVITFCPPNTTISCEASTLPANTGTATATDDCPGVVVSSSDVIVQGNCVNNYIINRTWKATDNTNEMATCLQTITVRDITPPAISCPGNVTVTCASQVPFPNPESGFMTSDNCGGGVFITFVGDAIINQVCTNRFQVARTYRATDACGNSATCQQTITVFDNIAPQLNCPAPQTFQCASDVPVPNPALVTSTDNCAGGSTVTFVNDAITNQTCTNKFTLTRTYRATDACGNSATCTQVFTVNDNTVPQLTCPAIITVQCASLIPAPNVALVTATDNCSGVPTVTFVSDVNSNVICTNKFTVTRTYRATDLCGNSATCSQTIFVNDNTVPTITCPVNVTVQCASLVPAVNTGSVVTADNCGPVPTVSFVNDVISNQTCTNRFVVTRTYRSTDACGNSATCSQVITVFDNTAPTLTCPANVTVQCAALVPAVNTAAVITADNCNAIPTVTFVSDVISNQTCVNRFIVTRTYRSTDECGNSATCAQIITVFDNTAPVITFVDPLIANLANGGRFDVQCHGQDPNWALPVLNESSVSTTDNCNGAVTVGFSLLLQDEGNCPVDGYITLYKLTWTATDACGNFSTKFVFMALVDHIAPVLFNIPADITVNCDEIPDPPTDVYATDECISAMNIQYVATPVGPGCQNGQVITRSWIATDDCGNKSTGTQYIHLIDAKPPVLQILQPELSGASDGTIIKYTCREGGIPQWYDDLNAESVYSLPSCGSAVTIKFDKNTIHAVNCKRAGYREQQTYHWYAVDVCGNETNLTIIAQLVDTEAPVILGVPDTACVDDPAFKFVEATDDCGEAFLRYWDVKIPNPCGIGTAYRRTYEAYDNCGNFTRDTSILIPNDHIGPVMKFTNPKLQNLPPGEVLLIDCAGQAGDYTPFDVNDVEVTDGCSGVTVKFEEKVLESHGCTNGIVATLSLVWTATDLCGNVSTLTVPAFVVDHTSPVLVNFKPEVTIGCKDTLPSINATDNCGAVNIKIEQSTRPGPCQYEYDITRTITATDPCGNVTNATQIIHVGDGSGPTISGVVPELCDDLSIPDVTAFDPCSGKDVPVTMTEKQLDSQCRDGKVFERTWTATDACGNVSTVKQIIIVGDKTPPEIQIPTYSIILKYLNAPGKSFVNLSETSIIDKLNDLDDGSVYVTDECDLQVIPQFTLDVTYSENCAAEGYFEHRVYTWTATDICGNTSSVSFDVYIMDDIAPVLIGVPNDATIICAQLPAVPFVSSPDPAQPVSIVYSQTILPGNGGGVFNVTRTWTGTDACGNVTSESQNITWIPDTQLECNLIVPQVVDCNSHGVVISSNVTGGLGGVTYNWEVLGQGFIQSGQGTNQITIYVGWTELTIILTITDAYGCTTTCSTSFQCLDTTINPFVGDPQTIDPTIDDVGQSPVVDDESAPILSKVSLWPNPVNGSVNLSFTSHANQEVKYRLINFLGKDLLNEKINVRKGFNLQNIDVSNIPEGSYLIELKTESGMYTKVVVIIRK